MLISYLILLGGLSLSSMTVIFLKAYQTRFGTALRTTVFYTMCMGASLALIMVALGARFNMGTLSIVISLLMGLLYTINMPLYQRALSYGSIGVCSVFLCLGGLIMPFLYGLIFLNEQISAFKIIGLISVILAILTQLDFRSSSGIKFFLYAIGLFLINGIFCVFLKVQAGLGAETFDVMGMAGLGATVMSGIFFLCIPRKTAPFNWDKKKSLIALGTTSGYGILNGLSNVINIYIATKLPATVQFPLNSAGGIVVSTLFGFLFFKEKPTLRNYIALGLSIVAIVLYTL